MTFNKILRALIICYGFIFVTNTLNAKTPTCFIAKKAGGSSSDEGNAIAVDGQGNSYVTGYFYGTATFGDISLTSSGSCDIFICKLDAQGNYLWAKKAGGILCEGGNGLALDGQGNSYVTGSFEGTASFGSSILTSSGSNDIFICKLDAQGNFIWAKKAGGNSPDYGCAIAMDGQGNSYLTGHFQGTASFGSITLTNSGNFDIFICKLDAQSNFVWATGSSSCIGEAIAVDGQGNSFVTGRFFGTTSFGSSSLTSSGSNDIFICKLNTQGNYLWAKKAGGSSLDQGKAIAVDGQGNSYVTGLFNGTASFGSDTLTSSGSNDIFICNLDTQGNYLWAKKAGGSSSDEGNAIAVDAQGNSYVTGFFTGTASFGISSLTSSGSGDIFICKLDAQGNYLLAKQAGGSNYDQGFAIKVDGQGKSYVTGSFTGTANFGSSSMSSSLGSSDIFICKVIMDTLRINPLKDTSIICGTSLQINPLAYNYTKATWTPNVGVSNAAILNPVFNPKQTTTYLLRIEDECGNYLNDFFDVTVNQITFNLSPDTTIICGSEVTLTAQLPQPIPNVTYKWTPTTGLDNPNVATVKAKPAITTIYTCSLQTANGCLSTKTVTVTVSPLDFNLSQNTTINCGDEVTLTAHLSQPIPNVTYKWTPGFGLDNPNVAIVKAKPAITTIYTCSLQTTNGCLSTKTVTITVNNPNPPKVNISSNTGEFYLCNGSLTLQGPSGFNMYQWSNNRLTRNNTVNTPGWYSLIAINQAGCAGKDSVEVTNLSTQPIKTPDGTVFCPDQTGQRLRLQAPEGMDSYKWSTGDETQSILVNTPGNDSVQVTKKGCNASVSVLTQMSNGQAHANFSYVPNGLKVNFTAISPSIQFATWNFGDGNTAVGELSTHTYKQSGNYNVTISVTDACGKNAEFTKTINVNGKTNVVETTEKLATINIYPNPNEGIFTLKSNSIEPFIIEIFDLQGSQLLSMQSDKKLETIDIRSLNKGIYILKAQSNKVILTERIILQ